MKKLYFVICLAFVANIILAQVNLSLSGSIHEGINMTSAANVIDGTLSTATVGISQNATLTIRLDDLYNICTIKFKSGGSDNDIYHFFISDTGDPWDFEYINTYSDPPTIDNINREAQYVRFLINNYSTFTTIGISEVEIYGCVEPIIFGYDAAGNRTSRTIGIQSSLKKGALDGDFIPEEFTDNLEELSFKMYPNPTRGLLTVEIENFTDETNASISIYDLQGRQIYSVENATAANAIDLSGHSPGTYILILKAGKKKSEWKIVKE